MELCNWLKLLTWVAVKGWLFSLEADPSWPCWQDQCKRASRRTSWYREGGSFLLFLLCAFFVLSAVMSTAALACRNVRGATKSSGFLIRLFPGMLWVPAAVQGRGRMGCVGGVSGDGSKWINEPPCPCNCIWRWLKLLWWPFLARIICLEVGVVTCETLRLLSLQHMCSDLDRAVKWSWITCACTDWSCTTVLQDWSLP